MTPSWRRKPYELVNVVNDDRTSIYIYIYIHMRIFIVIHFCERNSFEYLKKYIHRIDIKFRFKNNTWTRIFKSLFMIVHYWEWKSNSYSTRVAFVNLCIKMQIWNKTNWFWKYFILIMTTNIPSKYVWLLLYFFLLHPNQTLFHFNCDWNLKQEHWFCIINIKHNALLYSLVSA